MTARNRPDSSRPAARPPGPARRLAARLWANRPSLGALACLLAGPGIANVVLGWPLWPAAAAQWGLWALLLVTVSITEARRPTSLTAEDTRDGHKVPSHLGTGPRAATGEEDGQ
ncbi:hypothetical protein [Spirillospora sp. NPDC029432]|uniref:hypothetical protein n=1 Tax=Spirillospora sp. NPDC029432 TaxID=3154599 RepID=UPI003451F2EC